MSGMDGHTDLLSALGKAVDAARAERRHSVEYDATVLPPTPWPIPNSACPYCGEQIAWRDGIGRYVITHAHGEDRCQPVTVARLTNEDVEAAEAVLREMNDLLASTRGGQA